MSRNRNLNKAKQAKQNEFYTRQADVERELYYHREQFRGKTILCNCDDTTSSFYMYFKLNADFLNIKKIIATHYNDEEPSYKIEIFPGEKIVKTPLEQNGDFRSDEVVELLKEADIVCTNPPFSLFREYVAQLMEYNKKFLILGHIGALTYHEIFPLVGDNKMRVGYHTGGMDFMVPEHYDYDREEDGVFYKNIRAIWYTNLPVEKRLRDRFLYKEYNPKDYPEYDNYKAIEISKVKRIPKNYAGYMGVPITFLLDYNPDQFEVVGRDTDIVTVNPDIIKSGWDGKIDAGYIDGKRKYARIIIRNKRPET